MYCIDYFSAMIYTNIYIFQVLSNSQNAKVDLNGIAKGSRWEGNMEQLQILEEHS